MKKAFSLAEILLTLMIIGVIAGMTIPGLQKDAQNRTTVTNLKKVYSELNQATSLVLTDNMTNKFYKTDAWGSKEKFYNNFVYKYLNVIKTCEQGSQSDCWGQDWDWADGKIFLLSNGIAVSFTDVGDSQNADVYYMRILVDTNGPKPPNKNAVDRFSLNITGEGQVYAGLRPGANYDDTSWFYQMVKSNCNNGQSADYCAALVVMDGWQMNY